MQIQDIEVIFVLPRISFLSNILKVLLQITHIQLKTISNIT